MSATKYIRPMGFLETLGTMYRLYFKIMVPILLLNIILVVMSWWVLLVGAFVGPVLILASNAILGRPLRVLESFRRGIFSVSFLKIAFVSISYIVFIFLLGILVTGANFDTNGPLLVVLVYSYLVLSPLWIFIPMIMLLEKKGLNDSIKRSFQILRKYARRIVEMDLFISLFISVIAYLFSISG